MRRCLAATMRSLRPLNTANWMAEAGKILVSVAAWPRYSPLCQACRAACATLSCCPAAGVMTRVVTRSMGATNVLLTAPATPPARNCFSPRAPVCCFCCCKICAGAAAAGVAAAMLNCAAAAPPPLRRRRSGAVLPRATNSVRPAATAMTRPCCASFARRAMGAGTLAAAGKTTCAAALAVTLADRERRRRGPAGMTVA
jgi:hypothetical protein